MVTRLYPALPKYVVDKWSIKNADARALARFLDRFPGEVIVLEVGTFVGASAFHLASQPKVSQVVSVDYNPSLVELAELTKQHADFGPEPPPDVQVLEVAEAAFAYFPEQQRKVRFVAGTAESASVPEPVNGAPLIAFVDGEHSKEAVEADLRAIFEQNPHTVALLHDCRGGRHSPGALSGVAAFTGAAQTGYRFRVFEWLDPDWEPPNLGVLYPEALADQIEQGTAGLLADPASVLFEATLKLWERAERQRSLGDRLRRQVDRLEAKVGRLEAKLDVRRPWWRRFLR
jgi:hypothetical protein